MKKQSIQYVRRGRTCRHRYIAAALIPLFALAILFAAIPVSAALPTEVFDIPDGGLWFPFDGNAEEASGALTGKLRGNPGFVEGRDGTADGAIYFETEDQAVALQIDDIWGNWTASFWVKAYGAPYHAFLCSSMSGSLRVIQDNGRVGATINGVVDNSVPYNIPLDTWTMLTFAYDDDVECTSVYINGEFFDAMFGLQPLGLTLLGNDAPEQKGWQSAPNYVLDDAWFFGRLLTDTEIRSLYETNTVPLPEVTEPAETEPEEIPETPEEEGTELATDGEEEDIDLPEIEDSPTEENAVREPKPGAAAAMVVIALFALFLICAGARAIFGRSKS
ncbi:MAG: hypothetical protein J6V24_06745 [Clostridia bacterium]|nr:hypothetical protein [Clostridia bacterium]